MAEELLEAFRFFDKERKGYLTTAQYSAVLVDVGGVAAGSAELREFVAMADPKAEGNVYYEPLVALLLRSSSSITTSSPAEEPSSKS
jgi:Ca2+-binding EF-hand superfamily protein